MRPARSGPLLVLVSIVAVLPAAATAPGDPGKGRTFYVRQTVGDDANDGSSPAKAWRSLSVPEKAMQAGDTVYVGPGLYREQVTVANSGTAEARMTFIADTTGKHTGDPPGAVMITGADTVDETLFVPQSTPGLYAAPSLDGPVLGIVEMDGPQYRYKAAHESTGHLKEGLSQLEVVVRLPSSFFYDPDAKVVYIHTSDGKPPATHEIELIRRYHGLATFEKHYITVVGFTFRHHRVAGINFDTSSSHCSAFDNTCYGAWQGIRVCESTAVVVAGNTLFRNGNSGVYFLSASTHGYAIGNVLYENAKGARWSSGSASGLAVDNVAFANHEMGIAIENADGVRVSCNILVDNAMAQLRVMKSRYMSEGNCFESGAAEQLIAHLDHYEHYKTLSDYRQAVRQDLGSREGCGGLPKKIDVRSLHAETMAYAERAREVLGKAGG